MSESGSLRHRRHSKGDGTRGDLPGKGDRSGGDESVTRQRPEAGSTWRLIREYAGEIGLNPAPFSLRDLAQMAEGRRKQEWHRTAFATCAIANTWRGTRSALKVENFPYCQKPQMRKATHAECKAFAENFFR